MQPPRVVINYDLAPHHQWCWLPQWYSGSDSAYCLLAKFSRLNVLTIREICELFVQPNPKTGIKFQKGRPHYPTVDLRFSNNLSIGRMVNLLRLDPANLQSGFVDTLFPTAARGAAKYLKWCGTCAVTGFHSVVFQLDFVHSCPLHNTTLLHRCKKCASQLPYQLHAPSGGTLFCCPQCGADAAANLNTPKRGFAISDEAATSLASHIDLVRFADQLPTLIDKCRVSVGRPYMPLVLSKPDGRQRALSFRHFVANVLTSVSHNGGQGAQLEMQLLAPISSFFDPKRSEHENMALRAKIKGPAGRSVAKATDLKLLEATEVYKAIRRHLWKHHVCGHRACARYAMKSLWWDMDGERTLPFCKTALAFIRWRMQWEGRRVPSRMDESPGRDAVAYGLLGWISKDAPIPSVYWSPQFESWLNAHILAAACFDSFRGWIQSCKLDERNQKVIWEFGKFNNCERRHWACSGRGSSLEPGLLFLEPLPESVPQTCDSVPFNRMHFQNTQEIIKQLKR